jgi:AraC-like DNA-binding protein
VLARSWSPGPPLCDFIKDFWLYRGDRPAHLKERIVPSGTIELVVNLRDDEFRIYDRGQPGICERFPGAMVSGAYRRFFVIDTAEDTAVLGVHFKPGGALPFFGRPLCELTDTLALARAQPAPDWSRLAVDSGFFDQSHLIRDFVEFSGFSPEDFARQHRAVQHRGAHLKRNHVPLAG